MQIKTLMSVPAISCHESDSLQSAARQMWEHDCGALPVVDDDHRLVGIITDRDICMSAFTHGGGSLEALRVSEAMAKQVFSCADDATLEAVQKMMGEKQVRRIPIVDGDARLQGIVSLNDLARNAASASKNNGLSQSFAKTMATVCTPRTAPGEAVVAAVS